MIQITWFLVINTNFRKTKIYVYLAHETDKIEDPLLPMFFIDINIKLNVVLSKRTTTTNNALIFLLDLTKRQVQ